MKRIRGKVHRFGDDINTDYIIAAQHKANSLDMAEMAAHAFQDIRPEFAEEFEAGDIVVAGSNFGCGSSREAAVRVLTTLGAKAVVAKSFARIYFRNAINSGLGAVTCDTDGIEQGDDIEIDLDQQVLVNHTRGNEHPTEPLPQIMKDILRAGGIKGYLASTDQPFEQAN